MIALLVLKLAAPECPNNSNKLKQQRERETQTIMKNNSKNMSTTNSSLSTLPSPKVIAVQQAKSPEKTTTISAPSENKIDLQ